MKGRRMEKWSGRKKGGRDGRLCPGFERRKTRRAASYAKIGRRGEICLETDGKSELPSNDADSRCISKHGWNKTTRYLAGTIQQREKINAALLRVCCLFTAHIPLKKEVIKD